ncbi:MAG: flavin reductase [Bacteroidetes bacterium CG23_combo_of_CG06-09_8_20_14_all_32_9]|nr:MAG: flavin reductase [Bacteroidetes bacterium CG23_combo_of_CG06-09_8_20_14_all_32_9]
MFETILPEKLNENAIQLIGKEWMLISAGKPGNFNNMTGAWGGLGNLWNKPVAFIFIRPTRYTYKFIEENDFFTINFFEEKYRDILNLSGTKSGRDIDKMNGLGLTPIESENLSIYYAEARIVIECKKLYHHDINPENFLDDSIISNYPKRDFHRMYVGEIIKTLVKKS